MSSLRIPSVWVCSLLTWLLCAPAQAQSVAKKVQNSKATLPNMNEQQAVDLLVLAKRHLAQGQLAQAEKDLGRARILISDPILKMVYHALLQDVMEAKGNWEEASFHGALALNTHAELIGQDSKNFLVNWNLSVRSLFFKTIKNSMNAGLVLSSSSVFEKRINDISRDLLTSEEDIRLKKLADELRRIDRIPEAESIERIIFKHYPFVSEALRESLAPDTICRLDGELDSISEKRQRATQLVQRFGAQDDVRDFVLSLMGLPKALKIIETAADSLSGQVRSDLLDLVEWLHSIREYNYALSITSKLISSQNFEPPFTRDRLLMLHARNLNGVHRPVEAAAFYRGLILQYPESEIANTARSRYVLSLHYAQRYVDVAKEASSLAGVIRPRDVTWRTFWARYLSKQYSLAIATSEHELGQDQHARFQYWRGRAFESDGFHKEAKEVFKKVILSDSPSHYGLLASARLTSAHSQHTEVRSGKVAFAAKKFNLNETSDTLPKRVKDKISQRYSNFEKLIDADLGGLLRAPLRKRLQTLGASGTDLAILLKSAGDAHAGVVFAMNQRKIHGQYPIGREKDWIPFITKNSEAMRMLFPVPYRELVAEAARVNSISPWLILSIMRAESLFQPQIVSNVGARGLMQIMPTSGARIAEFLDYPEFEPAHLDQPEVSIGFGAWYLARLLKYYSGNLPLAIAAYNAGPEAVDRWLKRNQDMSLDEFLEDIPFEQTRKYVSTVLTNMETYSRLYSDGAKGIAVVFPKNLPSPRNDMDIF